MVNGPWPRRFRDALGWGAAGHRPEERKPHRPFFLRMRRGFPPDGGAVSGDATAASESPQPDPLRGSGNQSAGGPLGTTEPTRDANPAGAPAWARASTDCLAGAGCSGGPTSGAGIGSANERTAWHKRSSWAAGQSGSFGCSTWTGAASRSCSDAVTRGAATAHASTCNNPAATALLRLPECAVRPKTKRFPPWRMERARRLRNRNSVGAAPRQAR